MLIVVHDQGHAQTVSFEPQEEPETIFLAVGALVDELLVERDGVSVQPEDVVDNGGLLDAVFRLVEPGEHLVRCDGDPTWLVRVLANGQVEVQQVGSTATFCSPLDRVQREPDEAGDGAPVRLAPTLWARLRDAKPNDD